jgi:hypothetical protein
MKKNSTKKPTTETAAPTQPTPPEPQQQAEPQQEQKPDFYARLLTDRPQEAASIMATLNRRKDFALRQLSAHLKAGRNVQEAMHHAMAIAFPKHQQAAP